MLQRDGPCVPTLLRSKTRVAAPAVTRFFVAVCTTFDATLRPHGIVIIIVVRRTANPRRANGLPAVGALDLPEHVAHAEDPPTKSAPDALKHGSVGTALPTPLAATHFGPRTGQSARHMLRPERRFHHSPADRSMPNPDLVRRDTVPAT